MGRFLAALDQIPDRVVSSTAVRARNTVELAIEAGEWNRRPELESSFYDGDPESLLQWLRKLDAATDNLLLTGHEPTWSLLAEGLIGGGNIRFPTAALARIDLHVERWGEVEFGVGELIWLQLPRTLKKLNWPDGG